MARGRKTTMKTRLTAFGSRGLAAVLLPLVLGCGGSATETPEAKAPPSAPAKSSAEAVAKADKGPPPAPPTMCLGRQRITTLLAQGPMPPVPPDGMTSKLASLSATSGAKGDGKDLYDKVAPATVIIRAGDGMGTGVIIDPDGWVLTAYHVVRDVKGDDFTIKATVEVGAMAKDGPTKGLMERNDKRYEAIVHKADPARDLAILKMTDPPKGLPSVKIAKQDVRPGDPITVVGHAGVGLLWASKSGTVSTAGELGKNLASLVLLECKDDMAKSECEMRKKMHESAVADLAKMPSALLIQSTVATTRGDSGGPVVNAAGEVVGIVSFSNSDRATGVAYSYHVHGAEIRSFAAEIPKKPAQVTPNPWCDGGFEASLDDVDLDGKMDTLVSSQAGFDGGFTASVSRRAVMFDLDQDHFTKTGKAAPGDAPFDAELAVLFVDGKHYVYYDTDNDGRFDELLVDERGWGVPNAAWKIEADGTMTKDDVSKWRNDLFASAFKSAELGKRLDRVAPIVFPRWIVSPAGNEVPLPDPVAGGGKKGKLIDFDKDGRPDGVMLSSSFSSGLLFDADEDTLGALRLDADPQKLINDRAIKAELSIVDQGSSRWAFYDTNKDGAFDLALVAKPDSLGIATEAWRLAAGGGKTAAPEFVGRKLIRPGLLSAAEAGRARSLSRAYPVATDEGLGSVPSPWTMGYAGYFLEVKGWPKTVAATEASSGRAILIDVDRSTKLDPKTDVGTAIRGQTFDAELAEVTAGGMSWAFYDTDDDGKFDVVFFAKSSKSTKPDRAFRVGADGKLVSDEALTKGRWIRPALFTKKPIEAALKRLSKELFRAEFVEE